MHDGYEVFSGGDILVAVDGEPVPTNERLTSYLIQNKRPGDTASLTVVRDGQRETVTVTLGQRPVYGTD
jgi:S1-C subfamily serine protease